MSLSVNCTPEEFRHQALEVEREARRILADIHDCLSQRGERVLASLIRGLASSPPGESAPEAEGPGRAGYRAAFVIPDTRGLVAAALEAKRRAWSRFEEASRQASDARVRDLAATFAGRQAEDLRRLSQAMERLPGAADWERLLEQGTVPSLALGAERRLRRPPSAPPGGQKPTVT